MRTIIINAIGQRMQYSRLFFLPFREDELVWLDCELTRPEACVQEIFQLLERQNTRQDYHLVVLTDLSVFGQTEYEHIRRGCQRLLRAYWNERLLRPMAQGRLDLPCGVTEIFLYSGARENHGGVAEDKVLSHLLSLNQWSESRGALTMQFRRQGQELALDVSSLFEEELRDFRQKYARQEADGHSNESDNPFQTLLHGGDRRLEEMDRQQREKNEKSWLKELESQIKKKLEKLQAFRFELGGDRGQAQLAIDEKLFPINDEHPEVVYADLQLNLSQYIEALSRWNGDGPMPRMALTPHTARELRDILNRAESRLTQAQRNRPPQAYYKLESSDLDLDASQVEQQIRQSREALESAKKEAGSEEAEPLERLERGWFLVGREVKRFQALWERLKEQYNEEAVRKNQSDILDLCANAFHAWRSDKAGERKVSLPEATEPVRPRMELKALRQRLDSRQEDYFRANVAQLADDDDIRQEAVEIRGRFENLANFWSPKTRGRDLARFRQFSLVLAVIFLVIMILPYALIEWGQVDVGIPKYLWFLVSLMCFAVAYGVGVVWWLHQLWKKLRACTLELYHLMEISGQRRKESIEKAIEIYGTILPQCFLDSERLRELEELDRKNEEKEINYSWHDRLLSDTLYELRELRSALRLEREEVYLEPEQQMKPLDYDLPPWEGKNREAYLLFRN